MKGLTLKIRRIRVGLTQTELAKMVNLTQPIVSQLERGFYLPGPELIKRIKEATRNKQCQSMKVK